ncbi:DUF1289 domain-containing protein [Neiella marina]|uniref:DUF1289 domain-containing protein n=1 Tax=Neiella holothuriorum TaxID=2870530 RepID=A0ABS7ED29_9GAMM|nr:DUF1289 domain-containing protein [Neiella holothuriorum]MBW8190124.1 DUF1289 domain-containing protein [Neiella holothuriorum]
MSPTKNHDQLHLFDAPNPCQGICQTGDRGYCIGCFRKREERFSWQQFSDAEKLYVLKLCDQRKKRALKKQADTGNTTPTDANLPGSSDSLF